MFLKPLLLTKRGKNKRLVLKRMEEKKLDMKNVINITNEIIIY